MAAARPGALRHAGAPGSVQAAGEFIASSKGLGYLLNFAQNSCNSSLMMATVAVIMAIILAIFAAMERVESWAMGWKRAT